MRIPASPVLTDPRSRHPETVNTSRASRAAAGRPWLPLLLVALLAGGCTIAARAQTPAAPAAAATLPPGETLDPLALNWPRNFATNGYEFVVYQPQISAWPGNQLQGRFAIGVRPAGTTNETYGAVFFQSRTEIDKFSRLVTLEDFRITKMNFPTQRGMQNIYQAIIQSELPRAAKTIPLDHLEATYAVSAEVAKGKIQQIDNTPPRILYTTQPSLLVLVDGSPILKPLLPNYERVVNTRSIMLLNTNLFAEGYYLYAASNWYSAPSLEGPWVVNISPPGDINSALEAALATQQVDPAYPRQPLATPPVIYVSTTPTELLQSTGVANLLSVAGTDLLYVSNSDNAIFYYLDDGNYYVLISGRWFKSSSLYGPWAYVPTGKLPADFAKIPPDGPKSNVLLSVAGTPQAQEAVIASTIPQTATVYRDQAKLTVDYVGAPSFVAIPGTSLFYAANTPTPVIMVNAKSYYACENGIWFVSTTASSGPWTVATSVPAVIYTIPPISPIHYVTYVYVYSFTPNVVYMGYTPGYMGVIIAPGGVVVYGTGYVYPPVVVGTTYVSYPTTYGAGASFALGAAVGLAFGYAAGHNSSCYYEPHYGCYHYAYPYHYSYAGYNVNSCSQYTHWGTATAHSSYAYNPYTGTSAATHSASAYNPYTGAHGSTYAAGAANPYTGSYAGARTSSGYNPTTGRSYSGSTTTSGNVYSGNYNTSHQTDYSDARTGTSVNSQTSVSGNAYNGTASVNSSGTAHNSQTGTTAAWNNGNAAVDKNGNVYTSGNTSQNKSTAQSSWASASGSKTSSTQSSWASKESSAQSTGSQRANSWQSSGNGGWGGSDRSSSSSRWGGGGGDDRSGGGGWDGGGRGGGGRR